MLIRDISIRFVLCLALVGSTPLVAAPAAAQQQQTLSPNEIECRLDPACPKPHQHKRGPRGVTVEGGGGDEPLSVDLYVNFDFNSADLTSDARITLDQLGTALRDPKLSAFSFVIAGHTDAKGGADFNQKLSERRAEAVRSYMISQFGIVAERLSAKGYGKSQLLDPEHPEDGVNRRVQIINATASPGSHN
jgi:outer membrane protein OmpA-like peptidoglycan-associated protein